MKSNCWEIKKCGREPGGEKAGELGVCPASTEICLDGTHGGKNAGRACWVIAGSLCGGKVQGSFAEKYMSCLNCDFYKQVEAEESDKFKKASELHMYLKQFGAWIYGQEKS